MKPKRRKLLLYGVFGGLTLAGCGILAWWVLTRNVRRVTAVEGVASPGADEYGPPEPDAVALGDR